MEVPWQQLSAPALRAVIEEFITREGTTYGHSEFELDAMVAQIKTQLRNNEAVIVYDDVTKTANILPRK